MKFFTARTLQKVLWRPYNSAHSYRQETVVTDDIAGEQQPGASPAGKRRKSAPFRLALIGPGAVAALGAVVLAVVLATGIFSGSDARPDPATLLRWNSDPAGTVRDLPLITPKPTVRPSPSPTAVPGPPPFANAPFQMVIDKIGVNAPVGTYGLDDNAVPEVPLNGQEVAWYDFSAQPGTGSNAVFAGHVTWSGRGVFYSLNTLASGDTVRLVGDDGTELTYTVSDSFLVDPDDPNSLDVMRARPEDMITIITCDGAFYYTGDPVFGGDYTSRRIVQARLTAATVAADPVPAGDS